MRKLIISEEERKSILLQHINEGHTVSENAMGVAFGPEMNGLKIKKQKPIEMSDIQYPEMEDMDTRTSLERERDMYDTDMDTRTSLERERDMYDTDMHNSDDIIDENMMVAFGDEMNGLKIKKEETIETVEDDDDIIEENMMVAFGDEMNGLKIKKEEPTEGVSDMVSGLKGAWRGEGYDYFKYLSNLKRQMSSLQKLDKPNHKIMTELGSLKNKITSSKMPPQKRDNLIRTIDAAIGHFNSYTNLVQQIGTLASQKLN
jgi:hypothetical protein